MNSHPSNNRHPELPPPSRSPAKPLPGVYVSDAFASAPTPPHSNQLSPQSFTMTVAPPSHLKTSERTFDHDRPTAGKQNTLPVSNTPLGLDADPRRRSYDDGVRPLNILFGSKGEPVQNPPDMLAPATTSRRDKRHSISPGIILSDLTPPLDASATSFSERPSAQEPRLGYTSQRDKRRSINPAVLPEFGVPATSSTISPHSPTFNGRLSDRMQVPLSPVGREFSRHGSPHLQEYFDQNPKSPASSTHSSRFPDLSRSTSSHYLDENWHDQSRAASPSRFFDDQSQDQTIVVKSLPSTGTVGSVPPAKVRGKTAGLDSLDSSSNATLRDSADYTSRSLSPNDFQPLDGGYEPDSRPTSGTLSFHSAIRSRSVSPSRHVDVPSGVESETDTDIEAEMRLHDAPALLPEEKPFSPQAQQSFVVPAGYLDADTILASPSSDSFSDSSPVERIPHSTFIAPALPPIRLSLNAADFSELLTSVGGFPSLKSLDRLATISENNTGTPAQTANARDLTPTNRSTAVPPIDANKHANGQTHSTDKPVAQASKAPSVPPKPGKAPATFTRPNQLIASASNAVPLPPATSSKLNGSHRSASESVNSTRITLTEPESNSPRVLGGDTAEIVVLRLQEALVDARERGAQQLKMDRTFVEAVFSMLESTKQEHEQLRNKFDGIKVGFFCYGIVATI